jgi:hypothetical protein
MDKEFASQIVVASTMHATVYVIPTAGRANAIRMFQKLLGTAS